MFHKIIRDEDVGFENKELNNPTKRIGARGIVLKGNRIALFYKRNKNEYKLPGGKVEDGESLEEAFKREVLEETGCKVNILSKLGITEEFKGNENFYQISHIFLAEVVEDTKHLHLSEKEQVDGAALFWVSLDEAIEKVENCFDNLKPSPHSKGTNVYATKFIVKRDLSILQYYKLIQEKIYTKNQITWNALTSITNIKLRLLF